MTKLSNTPQGDTPMSGFYYQLGYWYCVVILDKTRRDPKRGAKFFVEEYRAESPEELIAVCKAAGYDIGDAETVLGLCESSPQPHTAIRSLH